MMATFFFCIGSTFGVMLAGAVIGAILGGVCHLVSDEFEFEHISVLMFILAAIGAIAGLWFSLATIKDMAVTVVPRVAAAATSGGICV